MRAKPHLMSDAVAAPRAVRSSVRGILGWTAQDYTAYVRGLSPAQNRSLNRYAGICAHMVEAYRQWASNLMLEWDGTARKSSYIAPYPLDASPEPAQELSRHRLTYLEKVYEQLPKTESAVYGQLLSPGYLISGSMPDIKAAYLLYRFKDVFELAHTGLLQDPRVEALAFMDFTGKRVTDFARILLDKMLSPIVRDARSNADSLFARLLLNSAVNRCLLESAEFARLQDEAALQMKALVAHLRLEFGQQLPSISDDGELIDVLRKAMSKPARAQWRPFKGDALTNIAARALAFASQDRWMAEHRTEDSDIRKYLLLAALAMAWSYCTKEEFDSRVAGANHRFRQVFNGVELEDPSDCPPALLRYHLTQFQLLWWSGQAQFLDVETLDVVHSARHYRRNLLNRYFACFKKFTLAQWAQTEAVLVPLLEHTGWSGAERLVDTVPT